MRVSVKGMSCQHCVNAVARALEQVQGVKDVEVSLERGEAHFMENGPVDREAVRRAIRDAGYEPGEVEEE